MNREYLFPFEKLEVWQLAKELVLSIYNISKKDQAYFSQLAYSSLMEVVCQLNIGMDLDYLKKEEYAMLRQKIMVLSNKINALHRSQKERSVKV